MIRRNHISVIAMMAIGSLLGYAAAEGTLNPARWVPAAHAAAPAPVPAVSDVPTKQEGCCKGVNKNELLALAAHNNNVAAAAQKTAEGLQLELALEELADVVRGDVMHLR